jgi:ABC-type polysaccharide/polyol phosphate export permease
MNALELIKQLTVRDFRNRYIGSLLGLFWAICQPLAMMSILWLVFTYGLKMGTPNSTDFACWFFTANIAWIFFQEVILNTTNVYQEYAYLVRKVNFRLSILPIVKILSSLVLHAIFIGIVLLILLFNRVEPQWEWVQVIYYTGCLVMLSLGMGWLFASLNVFMRDIAQIVAIMLQFGFWLTPIVWNYEVVPERWRFLIDLNPVYYITEGYRASLLYKHHIWDNWGSMIYFWGFTISTLFIGLFVFRRLRPHFADML